MTVSYGHGIAVTPLHLASAYAALVNGGVALTVEVLSPPAAFLGTTADPKKLSEHGLLNQNSIVLRVQHGKNVFLFPGDCYGGSFEQHLKATVVGTSHLVHLQVVPILRSSAAQLAPTPGECHATAHRLGLLGHIDHTTAAFADALEQPVASESLTHRLVRHRFRQFQRRGQFLRH